MFPQAAVKVETCTLESLVQVRDQNSYEFGSYHQNQNRHEA